MMADLAPPPGWETPARTLENQQPVLGPVGGAQIMAAPPGTENNAGSSDTIGGSVAEAVSKALADEAEHEVDTHQAGSDVGDVMPLPPGPDAKSSELGSLG